MSVICPRTVRTGACGAVYCGTVSDIDAVARVTNWTAEATAEAKTWSDSSLCQENGAGNFVQRLGGNKSVTGTVDFIYNFPTVGATTAPQDGPIVEGRCCYLILMLDRNSPIAWVIPVALITRFTITVNIKDAEPISGSFSFESSGIYYTPYDDNNPISDFSN